MRVRSIWEVSLPLQFTIGNKFRNTGLNQFAFEIDGVNIELLKKPGSSLIEKIRIDLSEDYEDKYLTPHEHYEYLSDFSNLISYKAGMAAQKFLDGFSRNTNDEYQIFDGEEFITEYKVNTEPSVLSGSGNNGQRSYYLDDEILTNSIEFAKKKKGVLDNSWFLIRDAENAMELGKYEISLIYMAIVVELLITTALSGYLKDNGKFKSKEHEREIKVLFGEKPSFIERYFSYGLNLITNKKLSDEVLQYIDLIYKVRNKLAHGKQLFEIDLIKETSINELNI